MQTIKAKEAAQAAMNINRVDWIHGAAELVLNNQVQYDRSTEHSKEAFISLDNVMEDVMASDLATREVKAWIQGGECCDHRDNVSLLARGYVFLALSQMADDFGIGVE